MTADHASLFQRWHERMTGHWADFHGILSSLENERDRGLADIQWQYEQLVGDTWARFHQRLGEQLDLLHEQTTDLEDQRQAEQLPLPPPAGAQDATAQLPGGQTLHLAPGGAQGAPARPPWDPAVAPPAPAAGTPSTDTGDSGAAQPE